MKPQLLGNVTQESVDETTLTLLCNLFPTNMKHLNRTVEWTETSVKSRAPWLILLVCLIFYVALYH